MLVLTENQICPLKSKCKYADGCWGTKSNRGNVFTCDFVEPNGTIKEDCFRNPMDKTGNMKVIID